MPLDARLLLRRARLGAAPEPLGFAPERVLQDDLAALLGGHEGVFSFKVTRVIAIDAKEPAHVAAIELENTIGDALKKKAIMGDGQRGKARVGEKLFEP